MWYYLFSSRHFKAADAALGGGIRHIPADDLIFVNQDGCIDRRGGTGVIVDLIHITHHGFACIGGKIISLTFLH